MSRAVATDMILKLLAVTLLAAIISATKPVMAQSGTSSPFPEIAPELEGKTRVTLRLPKFLLATGGGQIFAVVKHVAAEEYDVLLATGLPCEGGNNCTYGSIQGSSLPLEPVDGKGLPVLLNKEITGEFFATRCYAFCSQASIIWKPDGFYYSIGVKSREQKGTNQDGTIRYRLPLKRCGWHAPNLLAHLKLLKRQH